MLYSIFIKVRGKLFSLTCFTSYTETYRKGNKGFKKYFNFDKQIRASVKFCRHIFNYLRDFMNFYFRRYILFSEKFRKKCFLYNFFKVVPILIRKEILFKKNEFVFSKRPLKFFGKILITGEIYELLSQMLYSNFKTV